MITLPNINMCCRLQINKPALFQLDVSTNHGKLDATVIAPSGTEDEAFIQEIDDGEFEVVSLSVSEGYQ